MIIIIIVLNNTNIARNSILDTTLPCFRAWDRLGTALWGETVYWNSCSNTPTNQHTNTGQFQLRLYVNVALGKHAWHSKPLEDYIKVF